MKIYSITAIVNVVWYNTLSLICFNRAKLNIRTTLDPVVIHGIVCMVNAFCAVLQLANLDTLHINSKPVRYLRYVEWTICSPLMVLEMLTSTDTTLAQTISILFLTVAFCVCGLIAALSVAMWLKIIMGCQGTLYCIIVVFQLWTISLKQQRLANNKREVSITIFNLLTASLLWPVYVVTWGLGPDTYNVITDKTEHIVETITSLTLKTTAMLYAFVDSTNFIEVFIEMLLGLLDANEIVGQRV